MKTPYNHPVDLPRKPGQLGLRPWWLLALVSAASLVLPACGGGDVGVPTTAVPTTSAPMTSAPAAMVSLQGVAAVGLAIASSPVKIRCPREKNATYPISISKSNTAADAAVFKVTDASDTGQTIFVGQAIWLSTKGSLPKPLNAGKYYVVEITTAGFQLSTSPSGVALSTYGSTQAGLHYATTGKMLAKPCSLTQMVFMRLIFLRT